MEWERKETFSNKSVALCRLLRLAGKIGELLDERAHTLQPRFRQIPIGAVDEPLVRLDFQTTARILDQCDQPFGVCEPRLVEGDHATLRTGIDLRNARGAAETLDLHHIQEVFDLGRQRPEAVDKLCGEGIDLFPLFETR